MTIVVMLSRANHTSSDFYLHQPLAKLKKWVETTLRVNKLIKDASKTDGQ